MAINREKLLAAKIELPTETVKVPELGGDVIMRGMTGKEQTAFYKRATKKVGNKSEVDEETFQARLIAASLVDTKGEPMLKDDEFVIVQGWPGSVFNRLAQVALKLNGLDTNAGN